VGLPVIRWQIDNTCGHCYFPVPFIEGSADVLTNNMHTVRKGDHIRKHCCGKKCHVGAAKGSSGGVYVNNRPIQVQTNAVDCGDRSCNGSNNVLCAP
jgi:hypothetical protein